MRHLSPCRTSLPGLLGQGQGFRSVARMCATVEGSSDCGWRRCRAVLQVVLQSGVAVP